MVNVFMSWFILADIRQICHSNRLLLCAEIKSLMTG